MDARRDPMEKTRAASVAVRSLGPATHHVTVKGFQVASAEILAASLYRAFMLV